MVGSNLHCAVAIANDFAPWQQSKRGAAGMSVDGFAPATVRSMLMQFAKETTTLDESTDRIQVLDILRECDAHAQQQQFASLAEPLKEATIILGSCTLE